MKTTRSSPFIGGPKPGLKDLILEQIAMFRAGNWPPDAAMLAEFGRRHDTHYL